MKPCTALRKDGSPCRAAAVLRDPDSRCVFHSSLVFLAKPKAAHEVTKEELATTLGREIRRLRKLKDPTPQQLQRADAIRNLIILWREMSAPVVEPLPKQLSFDEKMRMIEAERKEK